MESFKISESLLDFSKTNTAPEEVTMYSIGWYFNNDNDWWNQYVLDFKRGDLQAINNAIAYFIEGVFYILELNDLDPDFTGLVTAIPHNKVQLPIESPLSFVAEYVEKATDIWYHNYLLSKEIHPALKNDDSSKKRADILGNKYKYINGMLWHDAQNFIILDDIFSSGATMKEISRSIRAEITELNFYGLTLGMSVDSKNSNKYGRDLDNDHIMDISSSHFNIDFEDRSSIFDD